MQHLRVDHEKLEKETDEGVRSESNKKKKMVKNKQKRYEEDKKTTKIP